jgi:hypothetical protein
MKSFRSFIFVLLAVCTLTASTPSKAAIGLATGSPITVVAGVIVAAGGAVTAFSAERAPDIITALVMYVGGIGAIIAGVIVLNGEEGQMMEFAPVNSRDVQKIGLTTPEALHFNQEIDQINALASYVAAEISLMKNPKAEDAAQIWMDVRNEISPEAFSALAKVSKKILR